jgi:hypothetical protein
MNEIYNMKLHETYSIDNRIYILRVPGGWIYYKFSSNGYATTFVPFNNEFQK